MKIASIAEVKSKFSEYIRQSEESPVVVTKNGRPTAVLIHIDDSDNNDELERILLTYNPKISRLLHEAETRIKKTGGLTHEEVWNSQE